MKFAVPLLALVLAGCTREVEFKPAPPGAKVAVAPDVSIFEVAPDGSVSGRVTVQKVILSEGEWRERLTPLGYAVTREKATEFAFTGKYDKHYEPGVYRCVGCKRGAVSFVGEVRLTDGSAEFYHADCGAECAYLGGYQLRAGAR
jgi:hypothetical protein